MDIFKVSLTNLESKKLLLDLKYWKEELEIKKEMIQKMDDQFSNDINKYLDENPKLKKKWDILSKEEEKRFDAIIERREQNKINNEQVIEEIEPIESNKEEAPRLFKKLYRDIVKKTHPDKFPNLPEDGLEKKKSQYKKATKCYNEEMYGDLLFIAYDLNIDFIIEEDSIKHLKKTLIHYKNDSSFIENTYTWKWYHSDETNKKSIISNFVLDKV